MGVFQIDVQRIDYGRGYGKGIALTAMSTRTDIGYKIHTDARCFQRAPITQTNNTLDAELCYDMEQAVSSSLQPN
jgi:hypothetical protein